MTQSILEAMQQAGLSPHATFTPEPSGKIQRFRILGDKAGSRNGWILCFDGPVSGATFGSWKTGESHVWQAAKDTPLNAIEQREFSQKMAAARAARETERNVVQAHASDRAAQLWAKARPATGGHPYLERKRIKPFGVRQLRSLLVVPARDASGRLHTLQFISPDGSKQFLSWGRISGCYCAIGTPRDALLLCEGFATGASLFAATGRATAVCFSAGNLQPVASALREKFPAHRLLICADNDRFTQGNPGVTQAAKAARAVGATIAVPKFEEHSV